MHDNLLKIHEILDQDIRPNTREFLTYWESIHPPDRLPNRAMFDPIDLPRLLPYLVFVDVLEGNQVKFQYRLLGTAVTETVGSELAGKLVEHGVSNPAHLIRMYDEIYASGILHFYQGPSRYPHRSEYLSVERVSVPISDDGHTVDQILTLMNYIYVSRETPPV